MWVSVAEFIKQNKANCSGCYSCKNACPTGAITFYYDEEGFEYPEVTETVCLKCQKCIKACPVINVPKRMPVKRSYACMAKDKHELMTSSSGGVFAVLARDILKRGGYVCGAAFDKDFFVIHRIIKSERQLIELKGTKYVQSKIGSVFSEVKGILDNSNEVLFSGTPCQVAGLKRFLNKDYDNLITIDLICHGVPSPMVWRRYLNEVAGDEKIVSVDFRNKEKGILDATMDICFESGKDVRSRYTDNLYVKGFLNNYYVRPSCYTCQFKGLSRCSDFTIGDFWAIYRYFPDIESKYGVSEVIVRTDRAEELLSRNLNKIEMIPISEAFLPKENECLVESVKYTSKRELFYKEYNDKHISEIVKYLQLSSTKRNMRILSRIKSIIKKRRSHA